MIEDINLIGLDQNLIDKIINELGYDVALGMACNYELIKRNIQVLKNIGIINIEELLLNRNNLFFMDSNILMDKIEKFDVKQLVSLVNEDYTEIDNILK